MRALRFVLIAMVSTACSSPDASAPPGKRAPSAPAKGKKEHTMARCPNAVIGAATRLDLVEDGVDLTITATDPIAQREILDRARVHAQLGDPTAWELEHTGEHGGPGSIGHCPIIHDRTQITVIEVPGGARVHVHASWDDQIAPLQRATQERVAALRR